MAVLGAEPDDPDRTHEQGRRQPHAEELDRHVALLCADEHQRPEAPFVERLDVSLLRALVAASPRDVRDEACCQRCVGLRLQRVKARRERRQPTAQPAKVDFVLIGAEVGYQSKSLFMASGERIYTRYLNGPDGFPFRSSSASRARLPRRMISASPGRFSSCRV